MSTYSLKQNSNTTNVKVKYTPPALGIVTINAHSNTTNVKVKYRNKYMYRRYVKIQIQPMLRLNPGGGTRFTKVPAHSNTTNVKVKSDYTN